MIISYIGRGQDKCDMCGAYTKEKYLAIPSIPALVNWSEIVICKKCARREVGTKNKKKWDDIHAYNRGKKKVDKSCS